MGPRGVALLMYCECALGCGRVHFDPRVDAPTTGPPCNPPSAGVVACYAFEGSTVDSSANHNNPVASGVTFVPGREGSGARLDAASSLVVPESSSLDVTTAFTFDAWIYLDVLPAGIDRSGILDNNRQYGFFVAPGGDVRCSSGAVLVAPAGVLAATWTHVACTYDGTELAVWRDGMKIGATPLTGPIDTSGIDGMRIGGNTPDAANPSEDPFIGVIDSLRIWQVALPPQAICAAAGTC